VDTGADIVVVGGGIIGLATAYRLLELRSAVSVVVLEKEPELGLHQSGRNSGVLHAGIYYAPGSLKARLAVEGKRELQRFADRHGIAYERCGKLVIARDWSELPRLRELGRRAHANGVERLREVDASGIRELEPNARGVAALHSPGTAIIDFREVVRALMAEVLDRGGDVRLGAEVTAMDVATDHVRVETSAAGEIRAGRVVACAGLQSDRVAALTGHRSDEQVVPFRGCYLRVRGGSDLVRGNVYPVPDPRFPFLGVHLTPRIDGDVWAGPNALLSLSRERYDGGGIHRQDLVETLRFPGTWRIVREHWKIGAAELARHLSRRLVLRELQDYVPDVRLEDLLRGPSGVRAQSVQRSGALVDDFSFAGSGPVLHVRNAPSPGATASLAIGAEIADRLLA
jgi:(S)-2-hydroxyglutarate dehydrogenase